MSDTAERVTYWHRDLPPIDAEITGEHTLEAASRHGARHSLAPR